MFSIIYADPPWDYKGQLQHNGHGAKNTGGAMAHYPTLKLEQLKTLELSPVMAPDCLLFMWVTSTHLPQGIALMESWGFEYKTVAFAWDKIKPNPGYYTMSQLEMCLVGKQGKIPAPRGARNERQWLSEKKTKHSAKPEEVRRRIERMFPTQAKLEIFARKPTRGWSAWGNEIVSDVKLNWKPQENPK